MINCQWIRQYMSDYLDNALEEDLRRAFDRHLTDCPSCLKLKERVSRTVQVLGSLPELKASASFEYTLQQRLRAEKTKQSRRLWKHIPLLGSVRYGPALAAAAVVLAAGTGLVLFRDHLFQTYRVPLVANSGGALRIERTSPSAQETDRDPSASVSPDENQQRHYVLSTLSPQSIEIRRTYRPQVSDSISGDGLSPVEASRIDSLNNPVLVRYVLPPTYRQVSYTTETFNP